jgi:hypothetical protein
MVMGIGITGEPRAWDILSGDKKIIQTWRTGDRPLLECLPEQVFVRVG